MNKAGNRNIFFFIFALSGFSGLIYESIWTHYLKLFLGHAAYAQTLVLAIFMGGMAIGAWICSRYSVKWGNLFIFYAAIEAIIGLSALAFHPVFTSFTEISYTAIIPEINNASWVNIYKWTAAASLILPQSILLGMTFPLMSAAVVRRFPDAPGNTVSYLYFTNSLGGALGILASGFILIKWIGLPGTIVLAGCINLVLALFMWSLCKDTVLTPIEEDHSKTNSQPHNKKTFTALLCIAFVTGAASFIYEIGWIRMLSLVLGASTHAFELMLSAFIFGLAAGGFWIKNRIDKFTNPVITLAWVQIIMGLFAMTTLILYANSFTVMQWLLQNIEQTSSGYTIFNLSSHALALTIMLPATFCAGMTLPLLTYSLIKQGYGEKSIGIIYSTNTVGAIVGILFAVHIGFLTLGLKGLIIFGAALDIFAGLALLWWFGAFKTIKIPLAATASACIVISLFAIFIKFDPLEMASGVYRNVGLLDNKRNEVFVHKDGKTASVDLTGTRGGTLSIRTNGKTDAAINMAADDKYSPDETTMIMAGALPLFINPQATDIAVIGMGSGLTSHIALQSENVLQVDTIEIEQAIIDVAKGFLPRNQSVYNDPRSRIYIEDAKTFFSSYNNKYDSIISEPSNPWVSGISGLFSSEFYTLIRRHLKKDGLLVQWIHLYEFDTHLLVSILKALASEFEFYDIYITNQSNIIIIAKNNSAIPPLDASMFNSKKFSRELQRIRVNNIQDVMLRKIGNENILTPLINTYTIAANSDYYPVLDQNAAQARFLNSSAVELTHITLEPIPVLELLGVIEPLWEKTNVTLTSDSNLSASFHQAQLMRDVLLSDLLLKKQRGLFSNRLSESYFKITRALNSLLVECITPSHGDKVFVLFSAAVKMVPYLRPGELEKIWHRFESAPCLEKWNTTETRWFEFFKALGERNKIKVSKLSLWLLSNNGAATIARKKYLVAAYMLTNIALNKKQNANRIWQKYKNEIFNTEKPRTFFEMIIALSKS